MLSRVRNHFHGAKFARMSSGTYCIIRDLGLVKGGKGMRHHEVLVTFSLKAFWRAIGRLHRDLVSAAKRRAEVRRQPQHLGADVPSSVLPESVSGLNRPALLVRRSHAGGDYPTRAVTNPFPDLPAAHRGQGNADAA